MSSDASVETVGGDLLGEVGRRLRARRGALGRTVHTVALDAGLSLPYVANLENGRGNPTLDTLVRLASALDVTVGDLLDPAVGAEPIHEQLPAELTAFAQTKGFRALCSRLAAAQHTDTATMRGQLVRALAGCPRPPRRRMSDTDWQRLLDAITLVLT
jgi:transcriptional regulator with XRE-family HTH domain